MSRHLVATGILLLLCRGLGHSQSTPGVQDASRFARTKMESCEALAGEPGSESLAKACEYALALPRTLPDLVCRETVERHLSPKKKPDIIAAELTVEKMHSHYTGVTVNGGVRPLETRSEDEIFAEEAFSWGEFALLFNLFDAASHTDFAPPVAAVVNRRRVQRYDFRVKRENNLGWTWFFLGSSIRPGYHGSLFIDGRTGEVARLVLQVGADEVDPQAPVSEATTTVEYGDVIIGEAGRHHVPLRSENVSCLRGSLGCIRATAVFRNFHKFGATTRIVP